MNDKELEAAIDANNDAIGIIKEKRKELLTEARKRKEVVRDAEWLKKEAQEARKRRIYAMELTKETVPEEQLKAMGFELYLAKLRYDIPTEPMAMIRLGDVCWMHYNRTDGSAYLTNNRIHMLKIMKAYLPRIFREAADLEAFIKAAQL